MSIIYKLNITATPPHTLQIVCIWMGERMFATVGSQDSRMCFLPGKTGSCSMVGL
jgi:hypothetical protein